MSDPTLPNIAGTLPPAFAYADEARGVGYLLSVSPCRFSRFSLATLTVDHAISCGNIYHQTIAGLTQVAPGRFIAVGVADMYSTRGALYVIDAPF